MFKSHQWNLSYQFHFIPSFLYPILGIYYIIYKSEKNGKNLMTLKLMVYTKKI